MCKHRDENGQKGNDKKAITLMGADMRPYQSDTPRTYSGYQRGKTYARLGCPFAPRRIAKDNYVKHCMIFADEQTAAC
jgi:hypothetical protein